MADIPWGPCAIGYLDRPTSDGRVIESGGFTVRTLPLPMDWQEYTDEGHENAVTIGRVDTCTVDPATGAIMASGVWLDPAIIPTTERAKYLADQRIVYPSVQPAGCEMEWRVTGGGEPYYDSEGMQPGEPYNEICVFTEFEFAKVTLVAVQAFPNLWISPGGEQPVMPEQPQSVTASVRSSGWGSMPVADAATAWDGTAAANRVADWAGINDDNAGTAEWNKYAKAFLYQDDSADPMTKGAYKLGVADVVDGELTLVPRGVYAVAGVLNGARGGADIPEAQQTKLKTVVTSLYDRIASALNDDTIKAPFSLVACAADRPPAAWFEDPQLTGPTPITITADGRIFGHIGLHGIPHRGLPGKVGIPRSMSAYREFRLGETLTAEGTGVPTGKVTLGGGHADPELGMVAALRHYDDVSTTVANVAAGDDEFGVWIAGAIKPGTTEEMIDEIRQSPPSGDWRTDVLGNLELITVHSVNTPGFPVYRVGVDAQAGYSLVASSALVRRPKPAGRPSESYVEHLAAQLSDRLSATLKTEAPLSAFAHVMAPEGFNVDAQDLRAEFAVHGMEWPTITGEMGGQAIPPFEIAEGCVRGALAACKPKHAVDAMALSAAQAKLARMRLAMASEG